MGRMPGRCEPSPEGYKSPQIVDLGGLREITEAHDLFFGSATSHTRMAMSSPVGGAHSGTASVGGASTTTPGGSGTSPASVSGGGGSASGVSGATGSGGGGAHAELPFTGYNVSMVAAIGSALSAAGAAIRHRLTRQGR